MENKIEGQKNEFVSNTPKTGGVSKNTRKTGKNDSASKVAQDLKETTVIKTK